MKKIIRFTLLALVFSLSLLLTAQEAHASGETFTVTDLNTSQTYDTSSSVFIYDAEGDEFGVFGSSFLFSTTEMSASYQSDSGGWELSYLSGGSYVTYPSDVSSFTVDGSTVTINTNSGDITMNMFEVSVYVAAVDNPPIISGNASPVQISYTQTFSAYDFKRTLSVTDDYDSFSWLDVVINSDGYTANKTNLGTYSIIYTVTDSSWNTGTFTKQIEVIDDIPPMFSGPSTITKPTSSILSVNDIKSDLVASDDKDGNRTNYIVVNEDNYTGHGDQVGSYTITFEVNDTKGNAATHTVTVNVVDDIPSVWYVKDGASIVLAQGMVLDRTQIISLLEATGQISISATSEITFFQDEYSGNENTPGVYMMGFDFEDASGNDSTHNFAITVLSGEDNDPINLEPETNLWDLIWAFIITPLGIVLSIIFVLIAYMVIKVKYFPKKKRKKNKKRK